MMIRYACMVLVVILLICGCSHDFEEVRLDLYGLVLPGRTTSNDEIIAKYVWEGGGNLREIAHVDLDYNNDVITITPYGLRDLRGGVAFPEDIFTRTDTVSLGLLTEGSYVVKLVGDNIVYYDTLVIPSEAPDSLFLFYVTVISLEDSNSVADLPLDLWLIEDDVDLDTTLTDTTDSSGRAQFTYYNIGLDSVYYSLRSVHTWLMLGIPDKITIGVSE
jgi:hypothetical protein